MITVTQDENRITLAGHAGYAEYGRDIVCAAVSALTFALQASIDKLTEDAVGFSYAQDEMVISFGDISEKSQLLINSFVVGIELISQNYPDNVRIDRA